MDFISSPQCKTESFVSPSDSEIYLCQAVRDLTEKLSDNIQHGAEYQFVIGAEGSGKTTLLNQLAQKFSADNKTVVLLVCKPQFKDLQQFLITVAGIFKTLNAPAGFDDNTFQKAFNSFFYKIIKQEKKKVLLLIDNGQNLPDFCLHALNSFYDYQPDCRRFLKTVICGEPSFQRKINANKALNERNFLTTTLEPFSFRDIRKLIHFHLEQAATESGSPPVLFSIPAQWVIYRMTQGHPKETIDLYHFIVLTLVIENRKKADWFFTLRTSKVLIPKRAKKLQIIRTTFLASLILIMLVFGLRSENIETMNLPWQGQQLQVSVPINELPKEKQPVKPEQETQRKIPQEPTRDAPPEISTTLKETLPPVIPPEEQVERKVPAKKSAAVPEKPEVKAAAAEAPVPEPAEVVVKEDVVEIKSVPEKETLPPVIPMEEQVERKVPAKKSAAVPEKPEIKAAAAEAPVPDPAEVVVKEDVVEIKSVPIIEHLITPVFKEIRKVWPGDTLLDMIKKVYGPGYLKKNFIDQVVAANPHLKSPYNLKIGDQVLFPVFYNQKEVKTLGVTGASESLPATKSVLKPQQQVNSQDFTGKRVVPPEYLGDIITSPDESLGFMVRRIYGPWSFNAQNVKTILAINPNLKSPELLHVGQKIRFPTIPVTLTSKAEEVWWARIITFDNIQSAYRFVRNFRKSLPPMVIIPSRKESGQVLMNILLEEYFMDKESALKAIQALPSIITNQAEAMHGLSPAAFYYRMNQNEQMNKETKK